MFNVKNWMKRFRSPYGDGEMIGQPRGDQTESVFVLLFLLKKKFIKKRINESIMLF